MFKKNKEPYEEIKTLIGEGVDYNVYTPKNGEKILWYFIGLAAVTFVVQIFYDRIIISSVIGIVAGFFAIPVFTRRKIEKRKSRLVGQFKSLLETLSTSIGAGKNVYDSFNAAAGDLAVQYTEDADMVNEVKLICQGLNHNFAVEDLLNNFADRSGLEDVRSFANVFSTCYSKGGNIKEVMRNTATIIKEKIEISMEIDTMVAGRKNEQNIMLVMPVVFILFLRGMGGDLVDLESPIGLLSVTAALVFFVVAYLLSRKILDIKI